MPAGDHNKIRVVLLGHKGSGKTALAHKWKTDKFVSNPDSTIGADPIIKEITIPGSTENVEFTLWDTAGLIPEYILNNYLKNANLCFITVDANLTYDEKIKQIKIYRELINRHLAKFPSPKPPRVVVLETKKDIRKNFAPVSLSELNLDQQLIPVARVIRLSSLSNINIDTFNDEITTAAVSTLRAAKSASLQIQPSKLKRHRFQAILNPPIKEQTKSSLLGCFTSIFTSQNESKSQQSRPNSFFSADHVFDSNLIEADAKTILEKLQTRLLEGAITNNNKEPYEVGFFGRDYVVYPINVDETRKIKIPKTVAAVIDKIQTVIEKTKNNKVSAITVLHDCYQDILNAAYSPRFSRYPSTQKFYEDTLPNFIEEQIKQVRQLPTEEVTLTPTSALVN